ncbi:MAG: TerB family tellurite resistance protein [Candidatus Promineofilum sp.]|nr:TerB family tellurite resistance protein [Promineifilum sp.]
MTPTPNPDTIISLAKVLIAAAWADGQISEDEELSLKDLLWRLPEVHARQWEELAIYLDAPVEAAERERLVAELRAQISSADQRELALSKLDEMVNADGVVAEREQAVVAEARAALESADVGLWGSLSRLLIGRRAEATAGAPNREKYLNDFVRNRVYYRLRQRLAAEGVVWDVSDAELRRLGLAGGLLALVAGVVDGVADEERAAMVATLRDAWSLPEASAALVVEVALSGGEPLDFYRLVREFAEVTTAEERLRFLDALFGVAAADGAATFEEIEQIRLVALGLKLSHTEFIDAKMKLPRERRHG